MKVFLHKRILDYKSDLIDVYRIYRNLHFLVTYNGDWGLEKDLKDIKFLFVHPNYKKRLLLELKRALPRVYIRAFGFMMQGIKGRRAIRLSYEVGGGL